MSSENLILARLQRLMCLGLDGQPAAELIAGTAKIWQEKLSRFDVRRLAVAFDSVEGTARRWPTPADVIAALPVYEHTYAQLLWQAEERPERLVEPDPTATERAKARAQKAIDECAAKLGVNIP